MKKFIVIFVILAICVSMFGCAARIDPKAPAEVDISQFPDAKEFDVFEWPNTGLGAKLPVPMWSNRGHIFLDSENTVWTQIGYSTLDDYNDYLKACQDAGFTLNYFSLPDNMYYGENEEGCAILIIYSDYEYFIDVKIATDADTLNM